jgi:hypothetical protein
MENALVRVSTYKHSDYAELTFNFILSLRESTEGGEHIRTKIRFMTFYESEIPP